MERFSVFFAVVLGSVAQAQNLVPNGSFEEYSYCPEEFSQFNGNVTGWSTCALTPDYFNECSSEFGVPSNWLGYQWAADGSGYAWVITYQGNTPHIREFFCAQLTTPLTTGVPVYLSTQVAVGGFGYPNAVQWTGKGIGMRLSTQPFL